MEGRLLLHTLTETANLALFRQTEHVVEPVEQGVVKLGVDALVEFAHILQGRGGVVKNVVGDVADGGFDLRVFVDFLAVHGDGAAVGPVNARQVPDGGGLARAVGAHKAIDRALGHRQAQILQGREVPEGLGYVLHFKHSHFLLSDPPDFDG